MKRREIFAVGEYYHIFNRGVEKRKIFNKDKDYLRFLDSIIFFNTGKPAWVIKNLRQSGIEDRPRQEDKLVDIMVYCLNPNHFHFLLKENKKNGITRFMKKICTGYAMYFNKKYAHSGVLFQGRFKSVHMDSNDQLLYVSAYVNGNSEVHGIEKASNYPWCSFPEYFQDRSLADGSICQKEIILKQFKNIEEYKTFCYDKIKGMKERKELED